MKTLYNQVENINDITFQSFGTVEDRKIKLKFNDSLPEIYFSKKLQKTSESKSKIVNFIRKLKNIDYEYGRLIYVPKTSKDFIEALKKLEDFYCFDIDCLRHIKVVNLSYNLRDNTVSRMEEFVEIYAKRFLKTECLINSIEFTKTAKEIINSKFKTSNKAPEII